MAPKPKIEPHGLDVGVTFIIAPPNSVGGWWAAGERQGKRPGGLEPGKHEMGAVWRQNLKPSRMGSVSVGPEVQPQLTVAWGFKCGRVVIGRPGGPRTRDARGGVGLARETEIRAVRTRYGWDLEYNPS